MKQLARCSRAIEDVADSAAASETDALSDSAARVDADEGFEF